MIILNNMYTGRYITQQGKLGHEAINLVRADPKAGEEKGKFYIWLNSMGVCKQPGVDGCTVLMVRTINSHLYKVLAKAEDCKLCPGANISRDRKNTDAEKIKARHEKQKDLATYNGKKPADIYNEPDMFATFCTEQVQETTDDIYITNIAENANPKNGIYYADFTISEAMRAYIKDGNKAHGELESLLKEEKLWKHVEEQDTGNLSLPEFNYFKLLRKDKDELSFSNAMAYFIEKAGIPDFLENGLKLPEEFLQEAYLLERERNNIDLSFFGKDHVVIIENKIDAFITEGRDTKDVQIGKAVRLYYSKEEEEKGNKNLRAQLEKLMEGKEGKASQLSKYYLFAAAHLLENGIKPEEIPSRINCFLLIPEYAKKQFSQNNAGCYDSDFLLSDAYRIITYKDMYAYFEKAPVERDLYLQGFLSALKPLKNEFNNDLEQEMKYRFFKTIGKL